MTLPILQKAVLRTERLTLKPHTAQDVDTLLDLLTHPDVTRTFMVPELPTHREAEALAKALIAFSQPEDTRHLEYGIYLDGSLIGLVDDCGAEGDTIEIGYALHPNWQGCGYATEAVRAVLADLREMGFKRVTAGYFAENTASLRVMEKCGMQKTAVTDTVEYRGERHTCCYCEICF